MYDLSISDFIDSPNEFSNETAALTTNTGTTAVAAVAAAKPPNKRVQRYCPKWDDMKHNLVCEWSGCGQAAASMDYFLQHVSSHLDEHVSGNSSRFTCEWNGCDASEFSCESKFKRHVKYHAFHTKLKEIGTEVLKTLLERTVAGDKQQIPKCSLDEETRNYIPELPCKFECAWNACEYTTDNPELFYRHIKTMHVDTFSCKTKNSKCLWSECEQKLADKNRLAEHIRYHSQEKLVACPTCGALFAVISKFIDHCSRSSELGSRFFSHFKIQIRATNPDEPCSNSVSFCFHIINSGHRPIMTRK